ncbi:MAG: hypothetical protein CME46_04490 [Halieaceae bacterium]|nr:hypothetical protein [Halieaceae bacterium]
MTWRALPDVEHVWLSILNGDETTKNTAGMRVNVNFTQLQFLKAYPEQQIICHLLASRPPRAVG